MTKAINKIFRRKLGGANQLAAAAIVWRLAMPTPVLALSSMAKTDNNYWQPR